MHQLVDFAQRELARRADPAKAGPMAAYMKTDMPFYGVQKAGRSEILRAVKRVFVPGDAGEYRAMVTSLWVLPHREEKYLAIDIAATFSEFITLGQVPLYEQLVVEGAWWDFVDSVASDLVGAVALSESDEKRPVLDGWIDDDDMWLRRTAILSQLRHKEATDAELLFGFCLRRAHETEFFIRKAIGWALRQYARTDPDAVSEFLVANKEQLSGLSFREAAKHLDLR